MRKYVEQLKEKPEPVRRRFAFAASAGITGLIAVAWLGAMVSSGTFALSNQPAGGESLDLDQARSSYENLVGGAGQGFMQAQGGDASSDEPALTTVEDGNTTSTFDAPSQNPSDATVIPF